MQTFYNCIKKNKEWALSVSDYFCEQKITDKDLWINLLRGVENLDLDAGKYLELMKRYSMCLEIIPDTVGIALLLFKFLRRDDITQLFSENEKFIFEISKRIWDRRKTDDLTGMTVIDKCYNTTTGIILLCWIYFVSYHESGIPQEYKEIFEEVIRLDSWEGEVAICILAGHFNFFCTRNQEWSVANLVPILEGDNDLSFINAWTGMVHFSRRINIATADILAPVYKNAVQKIQVLDGAVLIGFIDMFLSLLIYRIESPAKEYIPIFYRASSEDAQIKFIEAIESKLRTMDAESKQQWWNKWLKQFLENRKNNKPIALTQSECNALFMLLPQLDCVFDEASRVLCKGMMPTELSIQFWYTLCEKVVTKDHSESVASLLINLLKSAHDLGCEKEYIIRIVKQLNGLGQNIQKDLQEVLLKHGINVLANG